MLALPGGGVDLWRRSLQLRVVTGTLLLSALVAAFLGWALMRQVTDGMLEAKLRSSLAEASAGFRSTQTKIDAAEPDGDASQLFTQLAQDLASRGASAGLYDVMLEVTPATGGSTVVARSVRVSSAVVRASIPHELREAVRPGRVSYRYTAIHHGRHRAMPGLAVGSQLYDPQSGGTFSVYYLFPLAQEQDTLRLVQRALVVVGALTVGLLGGVAWLVARQVVRPVRMARETAERLAAGRLEERMQVTGRDDLARLATSFNQMASNLQRQIRQLQELSRVQRRFVSDVSHELRTPLTTVRMAADMLHEARHGFDPAVARSAELLENELDRFESLLADLLEISRFDAGAAALSLTEIDLRDPVRRVVDADRPLAALKGSRLTVDLPETQCPVEADPRRIERVIRNLVGNAIEYGEGGDIDVRVAYDATTAAVSVRDRGIGLKPGEAAMVFDRFWRSDPARGRQTGGTGLGLSIAIEDALLHGGWLQAWGEPDRGSHFRLTLPRHPDDGLDHSPIPLVPDDVPARPGAGGAGDDDGLSSGGVGGPARPDEGTGRQARDGET